MVNTLWLVKRPADFPEADLIDDDDIIVLIQDAVLRLPSKKNWVACEEDVVARNVKVPQENLVSYEYIINLIEKAQKVVVW